MSPLARITTASAPACPNCRNRIDLDLDKVAAGAEHQCLFCGHSLRVPKAILERLLAEREAARAAQPPPQGGGGSLRRRVLAWFGR